jgi:hypothetical protein
MRLCAPALLAVSLSVSSAATYAQELVVRVTDPNFTVTIPGQPQVQLGPHPSAAQNPSARLLGSSSDGFNVSALTPKAEGATAQQCASWLVGSTISRYAPDLAAVQFFPAGDNAWVLLYPFKVESVEQLKAHVFSGNNKGQCIEVHMSRLAASEQQRQAWFAGFRGITVKAQ